MITCRGCEKLGSAQMQQNKNCSLKLACQRKGPILLLTTKQTSNMQFNRKISYRDMQYFSTKFLQKAN